jgi:hypothetical protein
MAKVTPLSGDIMSTTQQAPTTLEARPVVKTAENKKKASTKAEPPTPLQIRIPARDVKAIKRAALDADQTVSDFLLSCFHVAMKK